MASKRTFTFLRIFSSIRDGAPVADDHHSGELTRRSGTYRHVTSTALQSGDTKRRSGEIVCLQLAASMVVS